MDTTQQQQLIELLRDSALGDSQAFKKLYQETSPYLYAVALKMMRAQSAADDVMQDAFVQIWHRAGDYHSERGSVLTWLSSIVRYRGIDALRKSGNDAPLPAELSNEMARSELPSILTAELSAEDAEGAAGPLGSAVAADDARQLQECMSRLSETQKQSVALAFFHGLTHQELSVSLALPLGTIKSRLRRSLKRLKDCLVELGYANEISSRTG